MSDDFGTINVRRGERAREIEVLRQHYRHHREALTKMIADAPTEHLAAEYQRLVAEIDRSLFKLDELEGIVPAVPVVPQATHEPAKSHGDPLRAQAPDPGSLPLTANPQFGDETSPGIDLPPGEEVPRSRLALIAIAAILALALVGWLIWRASSGRAGEGPIVEDMSAAPIATDSDVAPVENPALPASTGLAVKPLAHDFGVIRKGTRATRQFEIANDTDEPVTVQVARSACRCLFYEHAPVIPPKAKEALTVTVDGARAKAGELRETIKVTAKTDSSVATSFEVIATIR
jgi:hypothetical protein